MFNDDMDLDPLNSVEEGGPDDNGSTLQASDFVKALGNLGTGSQAATRGLHQMCHGAHTVIRGIHELNAVIEEYKKQNKRLLSEKETLEVKVNELQSENEQLRLRIQYLSNTLSHKYH